ncbi:transposase family protein [Desulfogranum japonicum]|uniref:transposase family protein n=1 Tax=Desulfogranum japonicum TaxID=231447 RepID=UPI0004259362|nr:transposase family protein [Desulfogranum japonicum]
MQHADFINQILKLQDPWTVLDTHVHQSAKRLDIYLGFSAPAKSNLFGVARKAGFLTKKSIITCPHCQTSLPHSTDFEPLSVQHLPILDFVTFLHVPPPGAVQSPQADCVCMKTWYVVGTLYTKDLLEHITTLLKSTSPETTAGLLGLDIEKIKQFDKPDKPESGTLTSSAGPAKQPSLKESFKIPDIGHPSWQRLINGDLSLATKSIALKMILQRIRSKYDAAPGIESGIAGAQTLHQFFTRNKKVLSDELEQLTDGQSWTEESIAVTKDPTPDDDIPAESHPVWIALITGEFQIQTRLVGLQMINQQATKSLLRDSGKQNQDKIIRTYRHFFIKHKRRLQREIDQLNSYQE